MNFYKSKKRKLMGKNRFKFMSILGFTIVVMITFIRLSKDLQIEDNPFFFKVVAITTVFIVTFFAFKRKDTDSKEIGIRSPRMPISTIEKSINKAVE